MARAVFSLFTGSCILAVGACIAVGGAVGCLSEKGATQGVDRQLRTWFDLSSTFAGRLEQHTGGRRWHIEPIVGVVPQIGDVTNLNTPNTSCDLGQQLTRDFAPLPGITSVRGRGLSIGIPLPDDWASQLRASANFSDADSMSVVYSGLRAVFVDDTTLRATAPACLAATTDVAGDELRLVRGLITGRLTAEYGRVTSADAGLRVLENDGGPIGERCGAVGAVEGV